MPESPNWSIKNLVSGEYVPAWLKAASSIAIVAMLPVLFFLSILLAAMAVFEPRG